MPDASRGQRWVPSRTSIRRLPGAHLSPLVTCLPYASNIWTPVFISRKVAVFGRNAEHLRSRVRSLNTLDDRGYDIIMAREREQIAAISGKVLVMFVK
jgi:hypothetical protein